MIWSPHRSLFYIGKATHFQDRLRLHLMGLLRPERYEQQPYMRVLCNLHHGNNLHAAAELFFLPIACCSSPAQCLSLEAHVISREQPPLNEPRVLRKIPLEHCPPPLVGRALRQRLARVSLLCPTPPARLTQHAQHPQATLSRAGPAAAALDALPVPFDQVVKAWWIAGACGHLPHGELRRCRSQLFCITVREWFALFRHVCRKCEGHARSTGLAFLHKVRLFRKWPRPFTTIQATLPWVGEGGVTHVLRRVLRELLSKIQRTEHKDISPFLREAGILANTKPAATLRSCLRTDSWDWPPHMEHYRFRYHSQVAETAVLSQVGCIPGRPDHLQPPQLFPRRLWKMATASALNKKVSKPDDRRPLIDRSQWPTCRLDASASRAIDWLSAELIPSHVHLDIQRTDSVIPLVKAFNESPPHTPVQKVGSDLTSCHASRTFPTLWSGEPGPSIVLVLLAGSRVSQPVCAVDVPFLTISSRAGNLAWSVSGSTNWVVQLWWAHWHRAQRPAHGQFPCQLSGKNVDYICFWKTPSGTTKEAMTSIALLLGQVVRKRYPQVHLSPTLSSAGQPYDRALARSALMPFHSWVPTSVKRSLLYGIIARVEQFTVPEVERANVLAHFPRILEGQFFLRHLLHETLLPKWRQYAVEDAEGGSGGGTHDVQTAVLKQVEAARA
ncbi:unnamed protein product, partial [Effrenium voratum]